MISLSDNVRIAPDAMFKDFDGESVILNLADESYYGLDEFGTRMWMILATSESIADACGQLFEEFDAEKKIIEQDVIKLVSEMVDKGILIVGSEPIVTA